MNSVHPLAEYWELDPETIYLNHGSFGPSPRPVRVAREEWSRQLERQPMRFFCQRMEDELDQTAEILAGFLGTRRERLALIDNATLAMNVAAHSIPLKPGDEVLLTDHEYGAVRNIWSERCRQTGAILRSVRLPFPLDADLTEPTITQHLTDATRVLVVSHVTSPTACCLPVAEICTQARQRGISVCVDGPHAIAMLDLNLDALGCDFYCGSCHKWLCAPFGSGFLWAHPRWHGQIRCPIVSWGGSIAGHASRWQDATNWLGTRDPAPLLAIRSAVEFFTPRTLAAFRQHAHELTTLAQRELLTIPGITSFCTPAESDFVSMVAVELPQPEDWKPGYHGHPDPLQEWLRDECRIEAPVGSWNGHRYLRMSAHLYTTRAQVLQLIDAVRTFLNRQ
ncbi:MAG: aminotransferase class V-fold PLP-dependent enzyme [Planctomycetaceae bacterium]|nr:aminotransferase class V-fold PLP-dependent enzyme [Planctomycetaceae bacterium]